MVLVLAVKVRKIAKRRSELGLWFGSVVVLLFRVSLCVVYQLGFSFFVPCNLVVLLNVRYSMTECMEIIFLLILIVVTRLFFSIFLLNILFSHASNVNSYDISYALGKKT
jgi:hypothetical protein